MLQRLKTKLIMSFRSTPTRIDIGEDRLTAVLLAGLRVRDVVTTGAGVMDGLRAKEDWVKGQILFQRPNKYANDVARKIWGGNALQDTNNKKERLKIAEDILLKVFPDRRTDKLAEHTIDETNMAEFVAAIKATLQRQAAQTPSKKEKKNKSRRTMARDDTTDEEEDDAPRPPADRLTKLPPNILAKILNKVFTSEDACSKLEALCASHTQLASLCKSGELYEVLNKSFGWTGDGSAIDIFKHNCREQLYGLPTHIGKVPIADGGVRRPRFVLKDAYMIASDLQKRLFVRHYAAKRYVSDAMDRFYNVVDQGVYGETFINGDWETAGITLENSDAFVLGREVLAPLEEQWDKIAAYWLSKGIDEGEVVLLVRANQKEHELEEKYEEIIHEDEIFQSDVEPPKAVLNRFLDEYVNAVLTSEEDDDDGSGDE